MCRRTIYFSESLLEADPWIAWLMSWITVSFLQINIILTALRGILNSLGGSKTKPSVGGRGDVSYGCPGALSPQRGPCPHLHDLLRPCGCATLGGGSIRSQDLRSCLLKGNQAAPPCPGLLSLDWGHWVTCGCLFSSGLTTIHPVPQDLSSSLLTHSEATPHLPVWGTPTDSRPLF